MFTLPPLDAHAHINPSRLPSELLDSGAVLAMTLSLAEAGQVLLRRDPWIAWGVGCHPRKPESQRGFNQDRFCEMLQHSAIAGELGLDAGSRVPIEVQLRSFRLALEVISDMPRLTSIHSYSATSQVLNELRRQPVRIPVLHWWTGTSAETRRAVDLGCYFSIHSQVARQSKFRLNVPLERVLVESDHGWADPPPAIPLRAGWVEYLVAEQYKIEVNVLRKQVWENFAGIIERTGTLDLLPERIKGVLSEGRGMKAEKTIDA